MKEVMVVLFAILGPIAAAFVSFLVIIYIRERQEWNRLTRIQRNNKPGGVFY